MNITGKEIRICVCGCQITQIDRLRYVTIAPYSIKAYFAVHLPHVPVSVIEFFVNDDLEQIAAKILNSNPDIVGFSCYLWNIKEFLILAGILKRLKPELIIALGGPEAEHRSEELLLNEQDVDFVAHGDAELCMEELVRSLFQCHLPAKGWSFRKSKSELERTSKFILEDLSVLPSPILNIDLKWEKEASYYIDLEASRGCPFSCAYCTWGETGLRQFPLKRVLQELSVLLKLPQVQAVYLVHSNPFLDKEFGLEICRCITLENRRNVQFYFTINPEYVDEEVCDVLENLSSGTVGLGLQSINRYALKRIGRPINLKKYEQNVRRLKERCPNISLSFDVICGLPEDTFDDIIGTLEFALSFSPVAIGMFPLLVLPGSRLRRNAHEWGIVFSSDPPYHVIETSWLSREELAKISRIGFFLELLLEIPLLRSIWYCLVAPKAGRIEIVRNWVELCCEGTLWIKQENFPMGITSDQEDVDHKSAIMKQCHKSDFLIKSVSCLLELVRNRKHVNGYMLDVLRSFLGVLERVDVYWPFQDLFSPESKGICVDTFFSIFDPSKTYWDFNKPMQPVMLEIYRQTDNLVRVRRSEEGPK